MTSDKSPGDFRGTIEFDRILDQAGEEPYEVFDRWPIKEVREECLEALSHRGVDSQRAEWLETRIQQLLKNNEKEMGLQMLSWYMFNSTHWCAERPLEFAIGLARTRLTQDKGWFQLDVFLRDISKRVVGRLYDAPHLYWYTSSQWFVDLLLSQLVESKKSVFSDIDWHNAERAVGLIMKVRDLTFLPKIESILNGLRTGKIKPTKTYREGSDENFTIVHQTSFLSEALRVLKETRKEQMADPNLIFGAYLQKKAGLKGEVIIKLQCPRKAYLTEEKKEVAVSMELEISDPREIKKLESALQDQAIWFLGEGFLDPMSVDRKGSLDYKNEPYEAKEQFLGLSCRFYVMPSLGANRFWLSLGSSQGNRRAEGGTPELAYYLSVE